jgi:intracellular multiplication protein IcmO
MALNKKYEHKHTNILRDTRSIWARSAEALSTPTNSTVVFVMGFFGIWSQEWLQAFADPIMIAMGLYFWWLTKQDRGLAFKLPQGAKFLDPKNGRDGAPGKAEGILYLGNVKDTKEEVWFTNSDARTHVLYLGTTGAGKTEGLKSMVSNALAWGSGFVYVDGKADTDLWSSLSALVRRFGRDDDLLVLNYMTGNSDAVAPSNTMNPFSSGSASYLVNMLVSLMPESEGDNAMWKERAVSLVGSMMPALTWKRDNQDMPLSVRTIRDYLSLNNVIKLQRDSAVPEVIRSGLIGYLDTLPGFVHAAYDDEGKVKPPGPDQPNYDTNTASQQHGYLAMQFTRSLQSLGDDYGYIFDTQAADVDMVDVVLNRRILIVLIPALEKSGDEIANLGKIVASTMKGMMGSALGSTVEGTSATVIENKSTHSATPFMTVFDEVGYYTAQGMAVMAAQARSLGFCLVFSGQDIPAMKKRVREEANSILANCNIKIFGKLEDPTETKDFFEKTVGSAMVTEVSSFQSQSGSSYLDSKQAGVQVRARASYDGLRGFKEGQAVITFGDTVVDVGMYYSNPGFAKAMRVTRFMALPPTSDDMLKHASAITKLRDLMVNKTWTAAKADVALPVPPEIAALSEGFGKSRNPMTNPIDRGIMAVVQIHAIDNVLEDLPPPASPPAPPVKPADPPLTSAPEVPPQAAPAGGAPSIFSKPVQPDAVSVPQDSSMQTGQTPQAPQTITAPPVAPVSSAPVSSAPAKTALPKEILDALEAAATATRKDLFKDDSTQ